MQHTTVTLPRMDCATEERLVRMAVGADPAIRRMDVDLSARSIDVYHDGPVDHLLALLKPLNLGATLLRTDTVDNDDAAALSTPNNAAERRVLRIAFAINAAMFIGESLGGYIADSSALLADSLDMFADAAVYAIALYGTGRAVSGQRSAARISGWLQLALAGGALLEVARRAVGGSEPESSLMMMVAVVALLANATTMWLLARHRQGGAHMKASWIFTTNDVVANLGVIAGGVLVGLTGSSVPDLVVGAGIAFVVLSGALRILRLS